MRNAFADQITKISRIDKRVVVLSGDIGNKLFDPLREIAPNRFINCGIAEGGMMSAAAGMALCGLRPFVYSITPFVTTRCFEQIRVGAAYHGVPITIVGTGSGLSYAELGPTHHSLEDIAIIRTLPDFVILAPCDELELRSLMDQSINLERPVYIRIGKKGEPRIHQAESAIKLGKVSLIKEGADICIISTGTILSEVLKAATLLEQAGVSSKVVSNHTIKPLDVDFLNEAYKKYSYVAVVEEHGVVGGLGSSILEWQASNLLCNGVVTRCIGTPDKFMDKIGTQEYARKFFQIDAISIAEKIQKDLLLIRASKCL